MKLIPVMTGLCALIARAQHEPASPGAKTFYPPKTSAPMSGQGMETVARTIAAWPARPRLGAQMMIGQYGMPQEITSEKLVWHQPGPYKRITVTKKEDHHDFPKPHMDFLEHTIDYRVLADKADALAAFDGSASFDRTQGELSARCDLEGHNILTLNIANDVLTGRKDAQEARKAFSEIVVEDMLGKHPAYVTSLQFKPMTMTGFADRPTIPGSPIRPDAAGDTRAEKSAGGDGETLGLIAANDENQVVAAMLAGQKQTGPELLNYAKKLHEEHGKHLQETLELGQKIQITPLESPAVDALRVKAAEQLAGLAALEGDAFARGYMALLEKGHAEALLMIDNQLLSKTSNGDLKKHLMATREEISAHLDEIKKLRTPGAVGGSPESAQGQGNQELKLRKQEGSRERPGKQ